MKIKTDIAIVGSGAGGAALARELARVGRDVAVIEKGGLVEDLGTQRGALRYYDKFALKSSREGTLIYRALMVGGTTVVSCGNGSRAQETELADLGIGLEKEFAETERELGIAPLKDELIGKASRRIMDAANAIGCDMGPMPKFIDQSKCVSCGKCVLGCPTGAKWSALHWIKEAADMGAGVYTRTAAVRVLSRSGRVTGILAVGPRGRVEVSANKVVLSAGAIASAAILRRSGVGPAGHKFFGDLLNVTYGVLRKERLRQWKEPTMAVVSTKFHKSGGYLISPFVDVPLVLRWIVPARKKLAGLGYDNLLGVMVKSKDDNRGGVSDKERVSKKPTTGDMVRLKEGSGLAEKILLQAGVERRDIIFTAPRAAHPGGTAPIGDTVNSDLETVIRGLYVCDSSVFPSSPGAPPIVTIIALAKRLSGHLMRY